MIIAIGGNALTEKTRIYRDISKIEENVIITHGNGPQVAEFVDNHGLKEAVAITQAEIGFRIQKNMAKYGVNIPAILTRVIVDETDNAFLNPTKPIGKFVYENQKSPKFNYLKVRKKEPAWRRVVPSPKPKQIVELDMISEIYAMSPLICLGGGGIPVNQELKPIDAVIDKDMATALLGMSLGERKMVIATNTDYVYLNYETNDQEPIYKMNLETAKKLIKENQFGVGSMLPKIKACIEFLERGGSEVVICSTEKLTDALNGNSGTIIYT